ncbi:phosphatidylinositol transfer protein alpha isoform-like [Mauremys reevesii]|uniref:phosphatidylinositol transfer protein alpha isoform-like n=1 Tax=Mauremys reevesii TaxID=260615 RepID=UPI00193EDCA7|nr:phosphatidylinositol transfer protein alpha isoform-like [Mauremys reevesii]
MSLGAGRRAGLWIRLQRGWTEQGGSVLTSLVSFPRGNWPGTRSLPTCALQAGDGELPWWGLQVRLEQFTHKPEQWLFTSFNRQLFCWLDKWVDLSMDDIRRMEEETQKELDERRQKGAVRGLTAGTSDPRPVPAGH